jgi:excisionase family DNA binding protein
MMQSESARQTGWLDLSEAAGFLGVHFTTLLQWVDAGKVPCIPTPGGRRRFRESELAAFLAGVRQGSLLAVTPGLGLPATRSK